MQYLLDSNAVIALLNDRDSPLANRVRLCKPGDIGMSSIVMHELFYGAFKSKRSENNIALIDALRLEVLDFDKEDARQSGELRAALAAQGTPIGPYDTLIAGQAKARNMTLITHNTGEFERVPGLHIEDWQA
jgi:tRNA(fMet)-specific endonuclease VapC